MTEDTKTNDATDKAVAMLRMLPTTFNTNKTKYLWFYRNVYKFIKALLGSDFMEYPLGPWNFCTVLEMAGAYIEAMDEADDDIHLGLPQEVTLGRFSTNGPKSTTENKVKLTMKIFAGSTTCDRVLFTLTSEGSRDQKAGAWDYDFARRVNSEVLDELLTDIMFLRHTGTITFVKTKDSPALQAAAQVFIDATRRDNPIFKSKK